MDEDDDIDATFVWMCMLNCQRMLYESKAQSVGEFVHVFVSRRTAVRSRRLSTSTTNKSTSDKPAEIEIVHAYTLSTEQRRNRMHYYLLSKLTPHWLRHACLQYIRHYLSRDRQRQSSSYADDLENDNADWCRLVKVEYSSDKYSLYIVWSLCMPENYYRRAMLVNVTRKPCYRRKTGRCCDAL